MMISEIKIRKNEYRDSVFLMVLTERLKSINGLKQVAVMMGTENNKGLFLDVGFSDEKLKEATPNDLIIGIKAENKNDLEQAFTEVDSFLKSKNRSNSSDEVFRTIDSAISERPDINFAIISIPGAYAAQETRHALDLGLNVLLFSDNVSLEDEVRLKKYAIERDLLVMGPDCGTAIINGTPLAFSNLVSHGKIGIISASGTGLQEVSVLIDNAGEGISQAIGTGGRDLHDEVGGLSTLTALEILESDKDTEVIIIISKPPGKNTQNLILNKLSDIKKPVIVNFLGAEISKNNDAGVIFAHNLREAAIMAVSRVKGDNSNNWKDNIKIGDLAKREVVKMNSKQRFVRGLYSGGTLCYETQVIWNSIIGNVYSNIPLSREYYIEYDGTGKENTCIDLGEDQFTVNRPHPMISPHLRNKYILSEALDPSVAVLILDIVLGYGSHNDMAGALIDNIKQARNIFADRGGYLSILATVCGTDKDPQNKNEQITKLAEAGVIVLPSNAHMAELSGEIIRLLANMISEEEKNNEK